MAEEQNDKVAIQRILDELQHIKKSVSQIESELKALTKTSPHLDSPSDKKNGIPLSKRELKDSAKLQDKTKYTQIFFLILPFLGLILGYVIYIVYFGGM